MPTEYEVWSSRLESMRLLAVWLCLTFSTAAQSVGLDPLASLLPRDARIIETAKLAAGNGKSRELVLWMRAPKRVMASWDSGPDLVYGDHWLGPASLSLVDLSDWRLINTVSIHPYMEIPKDQGSFSVPFFTAGGPYYVPHPERGRGGKPLLLHLQDLTGERFVGQFVLFDYVVSGVYATSVWGYSPKSDTAVQYPIELTKGRFKPVIQPWTLQVFAETPIRPGYWKFTWEPAHGEPDWVDEEVHFNPAAQRFVEIKVIRPYPGYTQVHCDLERSFLRDFFLRIGESDPDDLRNRVEATTVGEIANLGTLVTFHGAKQDLAFEWQLSGRNMIGIEFTAASDFAAALLAETKPWCSAN